MMRESVKAEALLLSLEDVRVALGSDVRVENVEGPTSPSGTGQVLRAAALDSGYRQYSGNLIGEEGKRPVAVSFLALVFDSPSKASRTFTQVADAAHLRTQLDGASVAVETVTAAGGLVSYWGFIHKSEAIVVLTLDTVDPQRLSVGDLRSLATLTVARLESAVVS